jgi:hypothetical protein
MHKILQYIGADLQRGTIISYRVINEFAIDVKNKVIFYALMLGPPNFDFYKAKLK